MSGHSHYSTIKRTKDKQDAIRGNLFSKLSKMIQIAIKTGGSPNPDVNFKLRVAIDKAKSMNMPKDNIERILKNAESKMESIEEITYEGFGPEGVSVIVETATDNRNRTAQEIKNLFEKGGGSMGGPGSVSFNFDPKGFLLVTKKGDIDEQTLSLIDLGAEDIEGTDEGLEIYVSQDLLKEVRDKIVEAGFEITKTELVMDPKVMAEVPEGKKEKVMKFLDSLEEHEDVQRVFANF
jgi:YebC/PmpR family DNA-binding regulatory protein